MLLLQFSILLFHLRIKPIFLSSNNKLKWLIREIQVKANKAETEAIPNSKVRNHLELIREPTAVMAVTMYYNQATIKSGRKTRE